MKPNHTKRMRNTAITLIVILFLTCAFGWREAFLVDVAGIAPSTIAGRSGERPERIDREVLGPRPFDQCESREDCSGVLTTPEHVAYSLNEDDVSEFKEAPWAYTAVPEDHEILKTDSRCPEGFTFEKIAGVMPLTFLSEVLYGDKTIGNWREILSTSKLLLDDMAASDACRSDPACHGVFKQRFAGLPWYYKLEKNDVTIAVNDSRRFVESDILAPSCYSVFVSQNDPVSREQNDPGDQSNELIVREISRIRNVASVAELEGFPENEFLGVTVPNSPWRVLFHHEKGNYGFDPPSVVRDYLSNTDLAVWTPPVLLWNPRYVFYAENSRVSNIDTPRGATPGVDIWRPIPPQSTLNKISVRMRWKSSHRMDVSPDQIDTFEPGEFQGHLRRFSGTGDFRIGLVQASPDKNKNEWNYFQMRIFPFLHKDASDIIGANDRSNHSFYYRGRPGTKPHDLINDLSQDDRNGSATGAIKLSHRGETKFGFGPQAPFDQFFDVIIELNPVYSGSSFPAFAPSLQIHQDKINLDPYVHATRGLDPFTEVNALYISFNNLRPYRNIHIEIL